ncbi:MAG: hypothetical protein JW744_01380, partial [Candidatus Diapherotrites archaeon]|nr:hypothetical protein [Candidatus Diapherotrites archaeon]
MKNIATAALILASIATIALSGCMQAPECGNDVCELLEDAISCPNDCATGPITSVCGNSLIETGENCRNCAEDVKCGRGWLCCNEACTIPVCRSNSDCSDGDSSTEDICINPGECNSKCDYPPLGAVCGNDKCETSEDAYTCPEDCAPYPYPTAVCGNDKCETSE